MRIRGFILWLAFLLSGIWALMTRVTTAIGASTAPDDTSTFYGTINHVVSWLASQPTWIPASIFFASFALLVLWFFSPGLRRWLEPVDFDDVRQWSLSFEWEGGAMGERELKRGVALAVQNCRFINLSSTQERVIEVKLTFPDAPVEPGEVPPLCFDRHSAASEKVLAELELDKPPLSFPLIIPANGVVEGSFYFRHNKSIIRAHHSRALTVFELRSHQHRTIVPTQCYDAKLQTAYRGRIGYPLRFPWKVRFNWRLIKYAFRLRQRQRGIERGIQP